MTTPLPITGTLISLADAMELASRFGETVTAQGIALAELAISLRTGIAIDTADVVDSMEATDRYWLAQAVVFQAIWAKGQPDLLSRIDQAQATTDGDAITVNHDGLILAPMAKWAILRTSYMSWTTIEASPTANPLGVGVPPYDPENVGWRRWHT